MSFSNSPQEREVEYCVSGRVEAGHQSRDSSHAELSGIEPWEPDRNVSMVTQASKTILSPFQEANAMATQADLEQQDMPEFTRIPSANEDLRL